MDTNITTPTTTAYVEHVAIRVRDIHWHIRFFHEAALAGDAKPVSTE